MVQSSSILGIRKRWRGSSKRSCILVHASVTCRVLGSRFGFFALLGKAPALPDFWWPTDHAHQGLHLNPDPIIVVINNTCLVMSFRRMR